MRGLKIKRNSSSKHNKVVSESKWYQCC